jgi:hypothetical protein
VLLAWCKGSLLEGLQNIEMIVFQVRPQGFEPRTF